MRGQAGIIAVGLLLATPGSGWACEPCASELNAEESMRAADLIIVGQRIDYTPAEMQQWQRQEGPGVITVRILNVVKGREGRQTITIHSWSAMCPYGIVVDDQPYVMLLERTAEKTSASDYGAVNDGCAVKTFHIDHESVELVEIDGTRLSLMSLEEFRRYVTSLLTVEG